MREDMNMTRNRSEAHIGSDVQTNGHAEAQEELIQLRNDLSRIAQDVRMKSKGASAEIQHTRRMLEREVKRFSAEVGQAVDRTQHDLMQLGNDLRMRYQKLTNQIVLPPN